jgi:plasmid stabilization system protein ParE
MRWQVVRTRPADADLESILRWTAGRFGEPLARQYGAAILATIRSLGEGPDLPTARMRPALGPTIGSVRVTGRAARSRHIVFFAVDAGQVPTIRVLRILHAAMDPSRHLGADDPA